MNQGDVSGVTPLMLSAALGHRAAVTTLMEFARAGHVRLDTQAKDDSDFTALDYAAVSGNAGLADQIRGRTKSTPAARLTGNKLNNNIINKNINNNNAKNMNKNSQSSQPYKAGEEDAEEITASALRDSNLPTIQEFARDLKALQAQNDTNLVALASSSSSSSSTSSRPGSRNASSATPRGRPLSQERAGSRVGSHSKERPASRVSCKSRGSSLVAGDDDDDLDLDLSSLRDLMGTVREAAKEIREIVEPMQREQEEAARPQEQRKRRGKKGQHHSRDTRRRNSGHRQQIQAEIHVISEINGRPIPPLPPATPLTPSAPPLDADLTPPTAFLHVENEELSHTWPRQKGRSVSRERTLSSGSTMPVGGATSEGNTPLLPSKYVRGPAVAEPHARVSPGAAESERQILDKVVGRQYGGPDPLVAAINSATFVPKSRLIMESRQRVVGRAREHWSSHQPPASPPPSGHSPLPHITISQHAHHHDGPRSPVDEEAPPVDAAGYSEGGEGIQAGPQPGGGPGSPGKVQPSPSPRVQPRGPQTAGQAEQHSSPTKASGKPAPVHTPAPQTGLHSAPALQTGPKSTPALQSGRNKPASQTGPNKPAPHTGLNKPAPQTGPNKPAPQTGPNKPAPQTGPNKPAPQTGPNKPAPQTNPNKPAPQTGPNKPAPQTGPNSKPAAQTGLSSRTAPQTGASNKPVSKPAVNAETNGRVAGGGPAGKAGGGPAGKPGLRRAVP